MGSKTRLSSYCTKRANNCVNLVTSRKINTRLARPIDKVAFVDYAYHVPCLRCRDLQASALVLYLGQRATLCYGDRCSVESTKTSPRTYPWCLSHDGPNLRTYTNNNSICINAYSLKCTFR